MSTTSSATDGVQTVLDLRSRRVYSGFNPAILNWKVCFSHSLCGEPARASASYRPFSILLRIMLLCQCPPNLIFTAPTELPLFSFLEEVGLCVESLSLVNLLRVRLRCFSAPGPSQFRPQRDGLDRPGYHLPPNASPKVILIYLAGRQRPT